MINCLLRYLFYSPQKLSTTPPVHVRNSRLGISGLVAMIAALICSTAAHAQIQIVSSERVAGNQLRLVFTDSEGTRNYQLQTTPQIKPSGTWEAVSGITISPHSGGGFELLTTAPSTGTAFYRITVSGSATDPDGDGLLTTIENQGWTVVTTDASGAIHQETVTSDPNLKDTDSDGLDDNVERQMNLNPRLIDTDGDGLTDFEESRVYFTNPAAVDTDNDAAGDPRFLDGSEVLTRGTSPNLADTDGDNRSDRGEFLQNGNALISDLPRPFIDIDPNSVILTLNSTYTGTVTTNKSYTQTLGQTESNSLSRSDATSTQTSYEASASITAGVEATAGLPPGVTVSASATVGFSAGFVDQNTVTVGQESSKQSQQQYEQHQEDSATFGTETGSGRIALSLRVQNSGAVAFTLKNLTITAAKRNPASPGSPQPVGTLQVDGLQDGVTIAPNESSGPLNAHFDSVTVDTMRELLRDPTQLTFMVGNFDLVDAESRNFAFLRDTNSHVTAGLTIDFGNGVVNGETGRVDRYRVATNVKIDENGFPQGVTLKEVFEKYLRTTTEPGGVPYTLGTNSVSGKRVVTSIRGVATDPNIRHFWVVAGSRLNAITNANFDEIRLMPSDQLYIFYVTDEDNDKLTDREEFIYGTSDKSADTDGDGINDYDEVRTGWTVTVQGKPTRPVYSDPRIVDTDNDGWTDAQEKTAGTDPRLQDTDLDGFNDNVDANPLVYTLVAPTISLDAPVVDQTAVSLTFHATAKPAIVNVSVDWGDGSAATVVNAPGASATFQDTVTHTYATGNTFQITATVRDVNGQTATASKSATTVAFPTAGLIGEYLFTSGSLADTSGNGKNGNLDRAPFAVPAPDHNDVNNRAYHFDPFANGSDGTPASIYIGNGSANTGWAYADSFTISAWIKREDGGGIYAIAGQDRSPILYLDNSQNLAFGIPNNTPVAKDAGNIPSGVWTHVAVTVEKGSSSTSYTLYKNGVKVDQKSSSVAFVYPNTSVSRIAIYSYGNNNPDYTTNFRGSIDSVRVYNRALRADEIEALANDTE